MATRNIILALAGLALAAGLGIALLGGGSDDGPSSEPAVIDAGPSVSAHARDTEKDVLEAPSAIATSAFDPEDEPWDAAGEQGASHAILVLDPQDRPVSGAVVEILRGNARWRDRMGLPADEGDEPLAKGRTDGAGRVLFGAQALRGREVQVRAKKDALVGFKRVSRDDPPPPEDESALAVVKLQPIRTLEITVKDGAGLPAGDIQVQVRGVAAQETGRGFGRRGPWGAITRWTSSARGAVEMQITAEDEDLFAAQSYEITASLYGQETVSERVTVAAGPLTRAEITVPVSVTVAVHVKDPDGQRYEPDVMLEWTIQRDEAADQNGRGRMNRFFRRSSRRTVRGGEARIGGFAPGATVVFDPVARERVDRSTTVPLPTSAGVFETDVVLGEIRPYVTVKLLEPDGRPAARARLQATVVTAGEEAPDPMERRRQFMRGRMRGGDFARTDEEGRIRVAVLPDVSGTVELRSMERALRGRGGRGRGRGRGAGASPPLATLAFSAMTPGETRDLGTVTLDRGSLLLAGKVVDSQDRPQSSVRVMVQSGEQGDAPQQTRRRVRRTSQSASVAEDGTFQIWGEAEEGLVYTATAMGRGIAVEPTPFVPGTKDLKLVVSRTGGVKGHVKQADPELSLRLDLSMRRMNPDGSPGSVVNHSRPGDDGAFVFINLLAGTYEFEITAEGISAFKQAGIVVPEGETVAPPALANVLVGQDFFRGSILVQDESSAPVQGARVIIQYTGDGGRGSMRTRGVATTNDRGEAAPVVRSTPGGGLQLLVRARGFAAETLKEPTFPLVVTLKSSLEMAIVLDPPLPERQGLDSYRLMIAAAGDELDNAAPGPPDAFRRRMMMRRSAMSVKPGQTVVNFGGLDAGRYVVRVEARTGNDSPLGRRRASVDIGEVELSRGAEARFVLHPDAGSIDAALEAAASSQQGGGRR